ncbi:hypothetical protein FKM82_027432 [Ascaphus truei]
MFLTPCVLESLPLYLDLIRLKKSGNNDTGMRVTGLFKDRGTWNYLPPIRACPVTWENPKTAREALSMLSKQLGSTAE